MSSEAQSIPFGQWYMDQSIPGHLPLAPSIFVGRVWTWIFSPVEDNGWEAVVEVLSRIIMFLILPIIALVALVLIPFGLITKSIGGCCSSYQPPSPPNSKAIVEQAKKIIPEKRSRRGRNRATTSPSQQPSQTSSPYPKQVLSLITQAQTLVQKVNTKLNQIDPSNIDIKILGKISHLLKSQVLKELGDITPVENATDDDLLVKIQDQVNILWGKFKSLKFRFNFRPFTIEATREVIIPGDGNCLFESWVSSSNMKGYPVGDAQEERLKAMEYICDNYQSKDHDLLQRHLVASMAQHYLSKLTNLEAELSGTRDEKLIKEIEQKIESLELIMVQVSDAFGAAFDTNIRFSAVESLVPNYIAEMSQPGQYGGTAELYALSCIHEVCVLVHNKTAGKIDPNHDPHKTMNPQFTDKNPHIFIFNYNHYNAYNDR